MNKEKYNTLRVLLLIIMAVAIILVPVSFYQYNTCKENAEYSVKAQANAILAYGWGAVNSHSYSDYEELKAKATRWLCCGIFSLVFIVGDGIGLYYIKKEYEKQLE